MAGLRRSSKIGFANCLIFMMFTLVAMPAIQAGIIKYEPNTFLEFKSLKCTGRYERQHYMVLTQICDECYNLFREPRVLSECRSNCFRNAMFPVCTAYLAIGQHSEEINKKINIVNGL